MRKRLIYRIIYCFAGSILVILGLFFISIAQKRQKNGFVRLFPPRLIGYLAKKDLGFNSYYIAGTTENTIFLGNTVASIQVITTNYLLTDTHHIALHTAAKVPVAWGAARLKVDSPKVFLTESIVPSFFIGTLDSLQPIDIKYKRIPFSKELPIAGSSYILRVYDSAAKCNTLIKTNPGLAGNPSASFTLTKQLDGIFCTDGILLYNKNTASLFYVYYYRNEFVKLDTNLQVLLKGNTIDTIRHAALKIITDSFTHQIRMAAPPVFVNKRACVTDRWLFINSGLMANNEDRDSFTSFSVIDVYSAITGKYKYSFYLPPYNGNRVTNFTVSGNHLIAIYDRFLFSFQLNF